MAIPQADRNARRGSSGPQADFDTHRARLEALGTVTYLGADHGLASLYDVAGLTMMSTPGSRAPACTERPVSTPAHLIEECEALGVNAELPKLIKAMADRSIAAGHGGEQYPVLIEEFAKPHSD